MKAFLVLGLLAGILAVVDAEPYRIVAETYPPYEYLDGDQPAGWDVEMINRAARRAGIEVVYEFVPWTRAESMARGGTADAIMSLRQTRTRDAFLRFGAVPLGRGQSVLYAGPAFSGSPTRLAEVVGLGIGTTANNDYGPTFETAPGLTRVPCPDQETLVRRLAAGSLPLGIMNQPVAQVLIAKLGLKGLRPLSIPLDGANLYIAYSRAAPRAKEFQARLDAALKALDDEGQLADLRRHFQ